MLDKNAVLNSQDVGCNPFDRQPEAGEAAMHDNVIALRDNQAMLVAQSWRDLFNEIEVAFAAGSIWALCWM